MPISIIGSFGVSLYFFTKVLTDYILKKKMIEKGYVGEEAQAIFRQHNDSGHSPLKWGLLTLFGGLGLIAIEFLDFSGNSSFPFGVIAVSLSLGFLVYYALMRTALKK